MKTNEDHSEPSDTSHPPTLFFASNWSNRRRRKATALRLCGSLFLVGLIGFGIYSGYVAWHEPDPQETVLLGQTQLAADSPAGLRIFMRHRANGKPIPKATVELKLRNRAKILNLGRFTTGADGTIQDTVSIPNVAPGTYTLVVNASSRFGKDTIERQVEVSNPRHIYVTTDKPLYQPGQTIHLRALMAQRNTRKPLAGESVIFEVSDAKGNKVFKQSMPASRFGIASTDFVLAQEVNEGRYQIRVESGATTAERTVDVKRYVLPKFKVTIATDNSFYRPGQIVKGSVQAAYFFGKPVNGSDVKLEAVTRHAQPERVAEVTGKTDAAGKFTFEFTLPGEFSGKLQLNENAFLDLIAEVRDTGEHREQSTLSLAISKNELDIAVFPEGGSVAPGITNLFYILTAYPDGRPASCRVTVNGRLYQTGAQGVCVVEAVPNPTGIRLNLRAWDETGKSGQLSFTPEESDTTMPLLLRTDQAVYRAGQTLRLTVLSSDKAPRAFIDIIRNRQTVLTRSLQLRDHRGDLAVALPSDLVGTLKLNAYVITETGEDRGCSRLIYVNPASGLNIQTKADKAVYLPGETARLEFQVTDADGRPAPAVLGICAVDESLFWLHENQPGLLQQVLDSETELLKPREQTRFFSSPSRVLATENQLLAQAYLASIRPVRTVPTLEELAGKEVIPMKILDRVRQWRGTPRYDYLRRFPEYREALQLLENGRGDYSLWEATGPMKKWAAERYRAKYFQKVKQAAGVLFGSLLVLAPFALICIAIFQRRRSAVLEVLVVFAILALLAGLMLPALAKAKARAASINDLSVLKQIDLAMRMAEADDKKTKPTLDSSSPRVRSYFPETLFWQPEVITDDQGRATLEVPLADSITTWRTSLDAISPLGKMGSSEIPIRVFQDFFVDLDLPVSLTLGDEVSVPVICYNYLQAQQQIRITLEGGDWFESTQQSRVQTVQLGPNEVKAIHYPVKVTRVGTHRFLVSAQGAKVSDAIEREINVLPAGRRFAQVENRTLQDRLSHLFTLPPHAIPGASSLLLKLYSSRFSEIVEGLDTIFHEPHGCFEQTSSTTYPNVLALDYLKTIAQLKPEIEIRARQYINAGYQRLLTFEVPGGGFEWFGHAPANVCLTAYGVLEFTDMARVHPVDPRVITRAIDWLFSEQNGDGSWNSGRALHSWAADASLATAYTAWAIAESGNQSPQLDKALNYLRRYASSASIYTKALTANALLARDRNDALGSKLAEELQRIVQRDSRQTVFWKSAGQSVTYSRGGGFDVETTALAVLALMKAGQSPQTVKEALGWLSSQKAANGTWHTTQATILAMRALIQGSSAPLGQESASQVTVSLNGKRLETLRVDKRNSDVMRLVSLTENVVTGANRLELRQEPPGHLACQIASVYWLPAGPDPMLPTSGGVLEIVANYDRTSLAVNDPLQCAVTVRNNTAYAINMAMVDLGIPPGFTVDPSAFQALQSKRQVEKFEMTGSKILLYLRELPARAPLQFSYMLTPKHPLRVESRPATVYEYYTPGNRAFSQPARLEVR